MQRAKEWLHCEEYREPRKMRHRTAKTNMIVVEGVNVSRQGRTSRADPPSETARPALSDRLPELCR